MENTCHFCSIAHVPAEHIWENDFFFAMLDGFPVAPGHTLIIPRRHVFGLRDLSSQEWENFRPSLKEVMALLEKIDLKEKYEVFIEKAINPTQVWFCQRALEHPRMNTQPDGFNHGVNEGPTAGQTVFHLHWHIIPRFEGDVADPRGGIRYVLPEMANYKIER